MWSPPGGWTIAAIMAAVCAALCVTLGGYGLYVRGELKDVEGQLAVCKASNEGKDLAIEKQSEGVKALKAVSDQQAENLKAAQDAASGVRGATKAEVARIMAEVVPKGCAGAMDWSRKKAVELNKQWSKE
jgi:hypothetical protein